MAVSTKLVAIIGAFFVVSISLVFINKGVMNKENFLAAPLFVTWFQCLATVIIITMLSIGAKGYPALKAYAPLSYTIEMETVKNVLPLSVTFVASVALSNLCLYYVEVSFFNVARSLTIVLSAVLSYFILGLTTSKGVAATLVVVIIGFILGTDGELNMSVIGTSFGVLSSLATALNSIFTKWTLKFVKDDKWALTLYNNLIACFLFLPVILIAGEHRELMAQSHKLFLPSFWTLLIISGIFGFLIGILNVMVVQTTSPLTHNIAATAKAGAQTLLAIWWYQNEQTAKGVFGLILVVAGSGLYAYVKSQETSTPPPPVKSKEEEVGLLAPEQPDIERGTGTSNAGVQMGNITSSPKRIAVGAPR